MKKKISLCCKILASFHICLRISLCRSEASLTITKKGSDGGFHEMFIVSYEANIIRNVKRDYTCLIVKPDHFVGFAVFFDYVEI